VRQFDPAAGEAPPPRNGNGNGRSAATDARGTIDVAEGSATDSTGTGDETGTTASSRTQGLYADAKVVLAPWLVARILVGVGYVFAVSVAHRWVSGGQPLPMNDGMLAWDGAFYRDIADLGYGTAPLTQEALRFFPLYPLLARGFGVVLVGHTSAALLIIANVSSFGAAMVMRRIVLFEKNDDALAERAVWITCLFPSAFVLVWGYAEALFVLLAAGSILAARRRRFDIAAGLALLAALTRPIGVLLAIPLAIEAVRQWQGARGSDRAISVVSVLAPVAGLGVYLAWVGRTFGDALLPFTIQTSLRGDDVDPLTRMVRGLGDMVGAERFGDGLHIPFALVFLALLVVVFRKWPVTYGAFAAAVLLAALSADNLNSLERYAFNAFPLVLGLASITGRDRAERATLTICGAGLVSLTALAWLGVYVP
jgi:hypothetical protein